MRYLIVLLMITRLSFEINLNSNSAIFNEIDPENDKKETFLDFARNGAHLRCGGQTSSKQITIDSSQNPPLAAGMSSCKYTFNARSLFVCQLRIDFDIVLAQPTLTTSSGSLTGSQFYRCNDDSLNIGNFRLCGTDRGQHIYVPFNRTGGTTSVIIEINLADRAGKPSLPNPYWRLSVTQLECSLGSPRTIIPQAKVITGPEMARTFFNDGFMIAPNGCTQYFPHPSGVVTSFNFNSGSGLYFGNMNYAICFRRTSESDKLHLTATHFQLGYESTSQGEGINEFCYPTVLTAGRSEDYLFVPQGEIPEQSLRGSHFCGRFLQSKTVTSSSPGPIMLIFHSDGLFKESAPETGFSFVYNIV